MWRGWNDFLSLAVPSWLMRIIEWWSWDIVVFLFGLLPDPHTSIASKNLCDQLVGLTFTSANSLGTATSAVVGQAAGAGDAKRARKAMRTALSIGFCIQVALVSALVTVDRQFGLMRQLYAPEPRAAALASSLLPWGAIFGLGHATQMLMAGAIVGTGKQAKTPHVLAVCYWVIGIPTGAFCAFVWPKNGPVGLWWCMLIGVICHNSFFLSLLFGKTPAGEAGGDRARCSLPWAIDWEDAIAKIARKQQASKEANEASQKEAAAASREGVKKDPARLM